MRSPLLEEMRISGPFDGNIVTFLRWCSKPDLDWLMNATSAHFLQSVRETVQDTAGKLAPFYPTENRLVITLRDLSLVQSNPPDEAHGDALTVVATILSEILALALHSDLAEGMEQSRIRCKFATIFATEGIVERLRSSLDDGPKRTWGVLGATPSEGPAIDG